MFYGKKGDRGQQATGGTPGSVTFGHGDIGASLPENEGDSTGKGPSTKSERARPWWGPQLSVSSLY